MDNNEPYVIKRIQEDVDEIKHIIFGEHALGSRVHWLEKLIDVKLDNIEQNQNDIKRLQDRILVLEKEDKGSKAKILNSIIALIIVYLVSSVPEILEVLKLLL